MPQLPPTSTLFPYTTLFRSIATNGQRTNETRLEFREQSRADFVERLRDSDGNWHVKARRYRQLRPGGRSEEHTSELQSRRDLVCRLLLENKKTSTLYTYLSLIYLSPFVSSCHSYHRHLHSFPTRRSSDL